MTRRHWFHLSIRDHGPKFVAFRKTPLMPADKEPPVPRLCVCPTVAACFAARLFVSRRPVHVYRTETPCRGVKPVGVWDQCVTKERWLVHCPTMVRTTTIDAETVDRIQVAWILFHQQTRKRSSLRTRVAQYSRAADVLGPRFVPDWESRMLARWRSFLGMGDPEEYMLDLAVKTGA